MDNTEMIPLKKFSPEPGKFLFNASVTIDNHDLDFLLDTGAATSLIQLDDFSRSYPAIDTATSQGASGITHQIDKIRVDQISLGSISANNFAIKRGSRNILGLDILKETTVTYKLADSCMEFSTRTLTKEAEKLKILERGHFCLPVSINGDNTFSLFDTGADSSVADLEYIKKHPDHFTWLRSEDGADANGNKIASDVYACRSFKVGKLHLQDIEIIGFGFPKPFKEAMEGTPVVIGNNIALQGNWTIDYKNQRWNVEV